MGQGKTRNDTDRDRLAALYDTFGAKLFAYALAIVDDVSDAEDVVQDVFVKMHAGREFPDDPASYLFRATRNAAYSRLRWRWIRRRLRPRVEQHVASFHGGESTPSPVDSAAEDALRELPAKQREVVMLKIWQGLTFQEIARVIRCSPNTAASRYRYALERLRALLEPDAPLCRKSEGLSSAPSGRESEGLHENP